MENNRCDQKRALSGRRGFLKALAGSVISSVEEVRGKPQMSLADLDGVPDDIVRIMVPVFNEFHSCRVSDRGLRVINKKTGDEELIRTLDETDLAVYDAIDGVRTVGQISQEVSRRLDLDADEAYRRTKSFFLDLARSRLCLPAEAYREETDIT